jgi:hypothetical protein
VELKDGGINDVLTSYKIRTLAKHDGYDCAVIDFKTELTYPIDRYMEEDSTVLKGEGRSKTIGVIYHAYDVGIIIEMEQKSGLTANLTEEGPGGKSKVVVKKKINRTYKLKEHILPDK